MYHNFPYHLLGYRHSDGETLPEIAEGFQTTEELCLRLSAIEQDGSITDIVVMNTQARVAQEVRGVVWHFEERFNGRYGRANWSVGLVIDRSAAAS